MTSHNEDEYFAKESVEKLRKLHKDLVKQMGAKAVADAKAQFSNRCPNCGLEMQKLPSYRGVTLLRCFNCGGAFVPAEAAEQIHKHAAAHEHAVVDAILNWLRPESEKK
jgi:hypothetical protein